MNDELRSLLIEELIVFLIFLIPVICLCFWFNSKINQRITTTESIISLNTGTESHGSFVLGSGITNSRKKYYTYIKDENAYRPESFPEHSLKIIEDSTKDTAYVKSTVDGFDCIVETEFHVPKGTITTNYVAD